MFTKSFAIVSTLAITGSALAGPVVINFDELPANTPISGDHYLATKGVSMRQVTSTPDATIGAFLTLATVSTNVLIFTGNGAVSPSNYAYAEGTNDMFFSFTTAVSSLSLDIDTYQPEAGDVVRLAALVYNDTGPNAGSYEVIAVTSTMDNPITTITLTVAPGQSFVNALFQSTTEQEGFDNLTFTLIPLPSGAALAGVGLLALAGRRRNA
jgi:hypothetical protein